MKDLDLAIKQQHEAVACASLGSARRPGFINNLGLLYLHRFEQFREVKDINFAIETLVEAVATTPLNSPHRQVCLYHLGDSYLRRFKINREPADLKASISNFRLTSHSLKGLPSLRIQGSLRWAHLAQSR